MAFYFDRAVWTFGKALEADLDQASQNDGRVKKSPGQIAMARQMVLNRWLGMQRFASPPVR